MLSTLFIAGLFVGLTVRAVPIAHKDSIINSTNTSTFPHVEVYPPFMYHGDAPYPAAPEIMGSTLTCAYGDITASSKPVLLVHGTGSKGNESWLVYAAALKHDGYDPCWIDLPSRSMQDNQISAAYVAYNLHLLSHLASKPVSVIGHSSGCPVTQWVLRWYPSAAVDTVTSSFVALAPDFQGVYGSAITKLCNSIDTNDDGVQTTSMRCNPSLWQQAAGSNFMAAIEEYARYAIVPTTVAWTHLDQMVWPAHLTSKLVNSISLSVQTICPLHIVDHMGMVMDNVGYSIAIDAIRNGGKADKERIKESVQCWRLWPEGAGDVISPTGMMKAGWNDVVVGIWGQELKVDQEPELMSYVPPWDHKSTVILV